MSTTYTHRRETAAARPVTRRRTRTPKQITQCAPGNSSLGFLKQRFLPVWINSAIQDNTMQMEKDFYVSLQYVKKLYGIKSSRTSHTCFPINLVYDFRLLQQALADKHPELSLLLTRQANGSVCLATAKQYSINSTLFYIPIKPLYEYVLNQKGVEHYELLVSVLAFVRQKIKMPHYGENSSYIGNWYHTIEEWFNDGFEEEVPETIQKVLEEFSVIYEAGYQTLQLLNDPAALAYLGQRVHQFTGTDAAGLHLKEIGNCCLELLSSYPKRCWVDEIPIGLFDPNEEDRIYPDQYCSFVWSNEESTLYQELMDNVNVQFQECGAIDEPVAYQLFDRCYKVEQFDFSFVEKHIHIMEQLCDHLQIYYGEYH
jgi:hypothetical protein